MPICTRCRSERMRKDMRIRSGRPVCRWCAAVTAKRVGGRQKVFLPSPKYIAERCEEIQNDWTAVEEAARRGGDPIPYTVPEVSEGRPEFADGLTVGRVGRHGY